MDIQKIAQEFKEGKSLRQLEKDYGVTRKTLSKHLKALGVEIKTNGQKIVTTKKVYKTDSFKAIKTEEQAYWFGFLSADATVYKDRLRIEVDLSEKDYPQAEALAKCVSDDLKPLRLEKNYTYKGVTQKKVYYRVTINSKEICEDLLNNGLRYRKSEGVKIPKNIEESELIIPFLRGYFDGDGTLSYSIVSDWAKRYAYTQFVGDEELILFIRQLLHERIGTNLIKTKRFGKASGILYNGIDNTLNVCKFLYKDANIYMERKYQHYQNFLKEVARLRSNS